MRLSDKEKLLLATVERKAGAPMKELTRDTGFREHTIRYHLKRLQERGVVSVKRPSINMNVLGFRHYTLLFSLSSEKQREKKKLLNK